MPWIIKNKDAYGPDSRSSVSSQHVDTTRFLKRLTGSPQNQQVDFSRGFHPDFSTRRILATGQLNGSWGLIKEDLHKGLGCAVDRLFNNVQDNLQDFAINRRQRVAVSLLLINFWLVNAGVHAVTGTLALLSAVTIVIIFFASMVILLLTTASFWLYDASCNRFVRSENSLLEQAQEKKTYEELVELWNECDRNPWYAWLVDPFTATAKTSVQKKIEKFFRCCFPLNSQTPQQNSLKNFMGLLPFTGGLKRT